MMDSDIFQNARTVIKTARQNGLTIATAESCTGGLVAKALTDIAGSSAVYKGSLIAYSNSIKENLLGVEKSIMIKHGSVSAETAREMAKNCAQLFGVDIALSVTGIAGPGGGSTEKPVGLVYMGVFTLSELTTHKFQFSNTKRTMVRREAALTALKLMEMASKLHQRAE